MAVTRGTSSNNRLNDTLGAGLISATNKIFFKVTDVKEICQSP